MWQKHVSKRADEVVVNLGGSFIAAGSVVAPKRSVRFEPGKVIKEKQRPSVPANDATRSYAQASIPGHVAGNISRSGRQGSTASERVESEDSYVSRNLSHMMTNERAFKVLNRIEQKLAGNDRNSPEASFSVEEQVDHLVQEATKEENLVQGEYPLCTLVEFTIADMFVCSI